MQSCFAPRFLGKRENDGARVRLMNIYFLSNIGPRLACMRTSRKTSARLKITFVDMTYPKGWTGSLLLCPLIFSWSYWLHSHACFSYLLRPKYFREYPANNRVSIDQRTFRSLRALATSNICDLSPKRCRGAVVLLLSQHLDLLQVGISIGGFA